MKQGDRVEAIVDRQDYKKGDRGVCTQVGYIDSEEYCAIDLDKGTRVGPVLADSWKTITNTAEVENEKP